MKYELKKAPVFGRYNDIQLEEQDFNLMVELEKELGKPIPPKKKLNWNLFGYVHQDRKIIELGLYLKKITQLNENIGSLVELKSLWLEENEIANMPASFANLRKLRNLSLNMNKLIDIPSYLANFIELKCLELKKNQFSVLPDFFLNMVNLEKLDLSHNHLEILPTSLAELKELKELNLNNNNISHLPDNIEQLQQVQKLFLSANRLTTLPSTIIQLTHLEKLYLENNPDLQVTTEQLEWLAEIEGKGCFIRSDFERMEPKRPIQVLESHKNLESNMKEVKKKQNWLQKLLKKKN